jgi:glycosyltransferase involved in cell wall biosynthesis
MHVLFIHRAFPAQFGQLAFELTRRYGWRCSVLAEHLSRCPSASAEMLQAIDLHHLPRPLPSPGRRVAWPQLFGEALVRAQTLVDAVAARPGLGPDLVVGHGGLTPTLLLREVLDCPIIDYCEYYFATAHRDLTYRVDLPPVDLAPFYPRCINAATLLNLVDCDAAYAATAWQRDTFPARFHAKIEILHDGIDTETYRPRLAPPQPGGLDLPPEGRIVTFVARGLESMRGFDLFMRVAGRIASSRADVRFVVVGGAETHYGWDQLFTGNIPFKSWVLQNVEHDTTRFVFAGHLEPGQLAEVLCRSDLHIYLSVPFVPSWSLLNAMACGCVVLAGDTGSVREMIDAGRTGLLGPLLDVDALADVALRVLADPGEFRPLRQAARAEMEERFGLDVTVPKLKAFFEQVATRSTT